MADSSKTEQGDSKTEPKRRKAGGRPFDGSRPGPGRPPGLKNKATLEIKEASRQLVEDPEYRAALKLRLVMGTAGAIEPLLYHYAYGKPKETIEVSGSLFDLLSEAVAKESKK